MLHRMSIHPVVQEAVPERLLMILICIKIFLFAIRMVTMNMTILSMLKRKLMHWALL